jgi:hypothetical protein
VFCCDRGGGTEARAAISGAQLDALLFNFLLELSPLTEHLSKAFLEVLLIFWLIHLGEKTKVIIFLHCHSSFLHRAIKVDALCEQMLRHLSGALLLKHFPLCNDLHNLLSRAHHPV